MAARLIFGQTLCCKTSLGMFALNDPCTLIRKQFTRSYITYSPANGMSFSQGSILPLDLAVVLYFKWNWLCGCNESNILISIQCYKE